MDFGLKSGMAGFSGHIGNLFIKSFFCPLEIMSWHSLTEINGTAVIQELMILALISDRSRVEVELAGNFSAHELMS